MHRCEFCFVMYQPRPQVKRPRACEQCQSKRQRSNEKAWHFKHKGQFDAKYYRILKDQRLKALREKSALFREWIEIGRRFMQQSGSLVGLDEFLFQFLTYVGIRRVNKLCEAISL